MNKISIIYVITRADTIAGAQRHVLEISQKMRELGHNVMVICGPGIPLYEELSRIGVNFIQIDHLIRRIDVFKDIRSVFELRKIFKKYEADLVSLHSSKAGIVGRLASIGCKNNTIFTAHGWSFADGIDSLSRLVYSQIERLFSKLCDRIICVSEADRLLAISMGIHESKLVTVHNGGHYAFPVEHTVERKTKEVVSLLMVGRLDKQKDHQTLIQALNMVSNSKKFELSLVGDGPLAEKIQRQCHKLGFSDKVKFKGLLKSLTAEYVNADCFVLSSNWEGFPKSTLEAMSCGLPVIVSDVGGAAEAVVDGVTGYVVPPRDIQALRSKLEILLSSSKKRSQMGQKGKVRFEEYFTFEQMFELTLQVYNEVVISGANN